MWSADELRSMAEAHYKGFAAYCPKCKARIDVRGALQSGGSVKLSAPSKSATTGSRIAVVNGEKRLRRQSMTKSFDVDGARPGVSQKPQRGPGLPWGNGVA
jgi:hypothetical protein